MEQASFVNALRGVQNFHDWKVPRIGGFVIFPSLIFVGITFFRKNLLLISGCKRSFSRLITKHRMRSITGKKCLP